MQALKNVSCSILVRNIHLETHPKRFNAESAVRQTQGFESSEAQADNRSRALPLRQLVDMAIWPPTDPTWMLADGQLSKCRSP
ncbi:hypothetical protein GWI33_007507 [Rhynchophorus ferrugineus]|uniref:Uncharacterized protein n=1 Tax=Rhynchophorus ferrugineus TaxID=354439 RepID=A0A834MGM5_RHYFE|nr:hypothetical protein GWI33_007507 [Rhynchophorus ferrugineus]